MTRTYISVTTPEDAAAQKCETAAYLAGGTEINRLNSNVEAQTLISMKKLQELKVVEDLDDYVAIGALCTFQELIENELIPDYLRKALLFMGSRQKRNMATIGGNIACLRDDSYLLATLVAADAELFVLENLMIRRIPIRDYIKREPNDDALILTINLKRNFDFVDSKRYANTVESLSTLVVSMVKDAGQISIAAAIKTAGIYELPELAAAAMKPDVTEEELIGIAYDLDLPIEDDFRGSAKYKRYLLGVTVKCMLEAAAKGGVR
ncbi:MAG: FAD binding domain-containing protein [Lachnospiraceae bacterium]|nr:FAD binding domain-containing protein [Candidatus Equihabitans merdae]